MERVRSAARLLFLLSSVRCLSPFHTAGGSLKWGISFTGDFLSSQTDGADAVLSSGRREEKEDREREGKRQRVCTSGGLLHCTTVHQGGVGGSQWIYVRSLLPLFYISVVFGQAPLYMCNYHWHCYFFQTQVQASPGWLVCFVSPGHS